MRRMRGNALGLLGCCMLAACGSSPPTRFYTLNEIAPAAAPGALSSAAVPVRVELMAIPAELDRLELVSHRDPNRVRVADSDRWAAPLDEQIRRVLSDDLAARLPPNAVADANEANTREPRRTLSVSIAVFEADESCAVTLHASWTLDTPQAARQGGLERIGQPSVGACPAALPAAMSQALATLSERLAPIVAR
jgi:uncharacterized lipoprotein YmbA